VKDSRRNVVELQRDQVLAAVDGHPFPVNEVVADEKTDREPGHEDPDPRVECSAA